MSILPVIVRELRAQARQPLTYLLRIVGAVSLVAAISAAFWTTNGLTSRAVWPPTPIQNSFQTFGIALFGKMNLFIFAAIWLFVPLAAADAVSRERREGTLGLLFLTELDPFEIVVGKAFVHILRSASIFLTMAPWLMLPVLFGGVELRDIRMAVLLDFTAVLLAMAAGLLASTIPQDWLKSVILAELFAVALLLTMLNVHGTLLSNAVNAGTPGPAVPAARALWRRSGWWALDLDNSNPSKIERTTRLIELATNGSFRGRDPWRWGFGRTASLQSDWQLIWANVPASGHDAWFHGVVKMAIGSALVLLVATWLGAWRVALSWRDAPEQLLVSGFRRRFLVPHFGVRTLDRRLSKALTANPIGWLQNYSPSARLVKWAWCLFVILVEIYFSANSVDLYAVQSGLGLLLLLGLAFSATASFRDELATGAFELLLVTPLRERQIITGRLRGLWRQFFPALLVYGAGSIYLASGWSDAKLACEAWLSLAQTISSFCTLPLIGLYFSVQRWNFFTAWSAASLLSLLPVYVGPALGASLLTIMLLQLGTAFSAACLLRRGLEKRQFLRKGIG